MDAKSGDATQQDDLIGLWRGKSELDTMGWSWWIAIGS